MAMTLIVLVAVPLAGMLGMASTSRSQADHRRESAQIARQIAAELSHSTAEFGGPPVESYPLIAVRPITGKSGDWPYLEHLPPNLAGHSVYLAYDSEGRPTGELSAMEYEHGVNVPDPAPENSPVFAIRIDFESAATSSSRPAGSTIPLRAKVTVGSPALGPLQARRLETFTTLLQAPAPVEALAQSGK
jgi:hypothetical protein